MLFLFGSPITQKAQRKKRLEGEVEVLKKQQKVTSETLLKECEAKKTALKNNIDAEIVNLQAQISTLKSQKTTRASFYDQELKVQLDKAINDFDLRITTKKNKIVRLTNLIEAERKSEDHAVNPDKPNAPRQVLNEDVNK